VAGIKEKKRFKWRKLAWQYIKHYKKKMPLPLLPEPILRALAPQ
jgi:hypothetical protein